MNFRKAFLLLALTATTALSAQETPSWIRRNAISPDGKTIAFSYKGDIWTVPVTGGEAKQLTSNKAYESDPVWAPDGQTLVFTSWREDSRDIYAMPAKGGALKRLTDLPGSEVPLAVAADGTVYFGWRPAGLDDHPSGRGSEALLADHHGRDQHWPRRQAAL